MLLSRSLELRAAALLMEGNSSSYLVEQGINRLEAAAIDAPCSLVALWFGEEA